MSPLGARQITIFAPAPYEQYVWDGDLPDAGGYIDAPVLRDENKDADGDCIDGNDERLYYTGDANMNVTALVETDGEVVERYAYDPYGCVSVLDPDFSADADGESDYDNAVLYCGYYHDWETGLYHVRHRVYHAQMGRWMQRDPAGYADGLSLYAYVGASPGQRVDPSGLGWFQWLMDRLFGGSDQGECYRVEERNLTERPWLVLISPHPASYKSLDGRSGLTNRAIYLWGQPYATLWLCCKEPAECKYIWGAVDWKYGRATGRTTPYPATTWQPAIPVPLPYNEFADLNELLGIDTPAFYIDRNRHPKPSGSHPGPKEGAFADPDGNSPPEGYSEVAEPPCDSPGEIPAAPEAPKKPDVMIMRTFERKRLPSGGK